MKGSQQKSVTCRSSRVFLPGLMGPFFSFTLSIATVSTQSPVWISSLLCMLIAEALEGTIKSSGSSYVATQSVSQERFASQERTVGRLLLPSK